MYSRYGPFDNPLTNVPQFNQSGKQDREAHRDSRPPEQPHPPERIPPPKSLFASGREEDKPKQNNSLGGLLKGLNLNLDSGDILLALILLLLYMDGDDNEILLIIALVLFAGF